MVNDYIKIQLSVHSKKINKLILSIDLQ